MSDTPTATALFAATMRALVRTDAEALKREQSDAQRLKCLELIERTIEMLDALHEVLEAE